MTPTFSKAYNQFKSLFSVNKKIQKYDAPNVAYKVSKSQSYNTESNKPEIEDFLLAFNLASDVYQPQTWKLVEIYKNIENRDAHLKSLIRTRISKISNRNFRITDSNDKELPCTELLRKKWFRKYLNYCMYAKFYGFSVIEFTPTNKIYEFDVTDFDRRHINIDNQIIMKDYLSADYLQMKRGFDLSNMQKYQNADNYYFYGTDKTLQPYFLDCKYNQHDLGLLEVASCLAILKRHSWSSWDTFEKLFGVATRIAKTNMRDSKAKNEVLAWLEQMGQAAYGVFEHGTDIEVLPNPQTDVYNVYKQKINEVDAQISKLILGSTMTTDTAANGNRNLGDIHQATTDEITQDDILDMQDEVNSDLIPFLQNFWKFPIPKGAKFEFYEKNEASLEQKVKVVDMLLKNGKQLDEAWLAETFDVKFAKQVLPSANPTEKKKSNLVLAKNSYNHDLHKFYNTKCNCCYHGNEKVNSKEFQNYLKFKATNSIESDFETLLKHIFNGVEVSEQQLTKQASLYFEVLAESLTNEQGFGSVENAIQKDMVASLRDNIAVFSAAKTIDEQKVLATLLYNVDTGNFRSFEDFKNLALQTHSYYKGSWLQAEYNYALRSANSAKQWMGIQETKNIYPLLEWQTAGDELVRYSHKLLDGIILPVDHQFWATHPTPLAWNCRCVRRQVSLTETDNVQTPQNSIPYIQVDLFFQNNAGITKKIFNDHHAYFARMNEAEYKKAEDIANKL